MKSTQSNNCDLNKDNNKNMPAARSSKSAYRVSDKSKAARAELIALSCEAKRQSVMIASMTGEEYGVNEILVQNYIAQSGAKTFKTFHDWKKEGYKVKKGETAFRIWGKPLKATKKDEELDQESKYKLFPMCCLFNEAQVELIDNDSVEISENDGVESITDDEKPNNVIELVVDNSNPEKEVLETKKDSFKEMAGEACAVPTFTDQEQLIITQALTIVESSYKREDLYAKDCAVVSNFCQLKIGSSEREIFAVLYLDSQNKLIRFSELAKGTLNSCSIHPREIIKEALAVNAAGIIITHNHPSGCVTPSQDDIEITRKLKTALDLFEITLMDHIIVSQVDKVSFTAIGCL